MNVKLKIAVITVSVVLVTVFLIVSLNKYGEKKSEAIGSAVCQLVSLEKLINQYYFEENAYPTEEELVNLLQTNSFKLDCATQVNIRNAHIYDAAQNQIEYVWYSKDRAALRTVSKSSGYIGARLNLIHGSVDKIEIDQ